ncbi:hypothetical protein AGABI1DRAFT_134613 [Agaricus bisporus var. burnettii JB137-S8]|uniref:Uncharacterized protein n=1 Tax=Agaricus bisporus var. burnettii (strain JB137-S8 / ATCC MYA-4627 / FGSC 10392) TaxID=597362 RepID=K5VGQ8_AGABU|nr:uncharacterized protein AGABI1DRAFT_134613 [Agaricus bisporus var. burnettii JB137-S8]EKM73519.1 hypothetical protein AGABI1DRAFT_134613 [Agaricus bisporus var. burnettii JB137-S8]
MVELPCGRFRGLSFLQSVHSLFLGLLSQFLSVQLFCRLVRIATATAIVLPLIEGVWLPEGVVVDVEALRRVGDAPKRVEVVSQA